MSLQTLAIGLTIALFFALWAIRILGDKYYRSGRSRSSDEGVADDPRRAKPNELPQRPDRINRPSSSRLLATPSRQSGLIVGRRSRSRLTAAARLSSFTRNSLLRRRKS